MAFPNEVRSLYNSLVSSGAIRFANYPANAAGAAVTTGKSYAYGAWAQVAADDFITINGWLTSLCLDTASASDIYLIGVGVGAAGSEVLLWEGRVDLIAASLIGWGPMNFPRPLYLNPANNNRIAAEGAAGSANARTINASLTVGTRFLGTGT